MEKPINPTNIQPLFSRVLMKIYEKKVSIFIPEGAKDGSLKASQGEVIAVGESVLDLKPGDKVTWGKYAGVNIKCSGERYIMMNDEDVLGLLTGGYINE